MLQREYGLATPSSLTPVIHPEDAQPNEAINKRRQKLPPAIRNTAPRLTSTHYRGFRGRGGYSNRGGGMSQRGQPGQLTQHAVRGNPSWRGRGGGNASWKAPTYGEGRKSNECPRNPIEQSETIVVSSSSSSSSSASESSNHLRKARSREAKPNSRHTLPTYSSQTSATPPAPPNHSTSHSWMNRSRSPTPKLPSLPPLKRRKLEHPNSEPPRSQENEHGRSISAEASSSRMPPPASVPRLPLPGRGRMKDSTTVAEPTPTVHVKEERFSPVKLEVTVEASVKREVVSPSPEPSVVSERKLIKEATKFYNFPESCHKSDPSCRENRVAFFKEKKRGLVSLGLKVIKVMSRDDGLAIDWTSPRPVWSDTLQPNLPDLAAAIQLAHEINHESSSPKRKSTSTSSRPSSSQAVVASSPSTLNKAEERRPSRSPTKEHTPQRHGPSSQMSPPLTPDSHLFPKRRLPLPSPGRQSQSQNVPASPSPVVLPVAFSPPRRSATPASAAAAASWQQQQHLRRLSNSSSTSAGMNMDVDEYPVVLPVATPVSASKQHFSFPATLVKADALPPPPLAQAPAAAKRLIFKPNPNSLRNHVPATSSKPEKASDAVFPRAPDSNGPETGAKPNTKQVLGAASSAHGLQAQAVVDQETKHAFGPLDLLPALPLSAAVAEEEQNENENENATTTASLTMSQDSILTSVPRNSILDETEITRTCPPNKIGHRKTDSYGDRIEAEDVASALLLSRDDVDVDVSDEDDSMTSISTDGGETEVHVAEFLQRYCQLFDADRSKLEMAYAKNALFSCRVHHLEEPSFSMAGLFAPEVKPSFRSSHSRASASTVDQGRTQIGNRLLALGPYQFCPRGVTRSLHYDVVDSGGAAGILVTVHGEVVNPNIAGPHLDHVLTLDQSFVLRQRGAVGVGVGVGGRMGMGGAVGDGDGCEDDEDNDDGINGLGQRVEQKWPLVAISHQMTVRAAPLLPPDKLEEYLPWIQNIL